MMRNDSSRRLRRFAALAALFAFTSAAMLQSPALAKHKAASSDAADDSSSDKKGKKSEKGKSRQLGVFGGWSALAATGRDKTCYALGSPKEREPRAKLKDTSAFVFISTRPGEGVHEEVAIDLGYPTKDNSAASADIDGDAYALVTKGTNAWVKDPTQEKEFVKSLKDGGKLIVKASSARGVSTTDTYALKGLSEALARAAQECK